VVLTDMINFYFSSCMGEMGNLLRVDFFSFVKSNKVFN
jgi:hypothetical protein